MTIYCPHTFNKLCVLSVTGLTLPKKDNILNKYVLCLNLKFFFFSGSVRTAIPKKYNY